MGRVARIVPEFSACRTLPRRVTLCAQRNKNFFTREAFYLFNCCTNAVIRRVGWAHHLSSGLSPANWRARRRVPKRDGSRLGSPTLRNCFALHLLEGGHDIRTVQELLVYGDVER